MDQENNINPPSFFGTTEHLLNMLPKEVITWLVKNTVKDMTVMETAGSIVIDAYFEELDSPIRFLEARAIHAEDRKGIARGTICNIISSVERVTQVSKDDIILRSKAPHIYRARCLLVGLIRELTTLSIADIGRVLDRDHTTLLYTLRRYDGLLENDDSFYIAAKSIKEDFGR